MHIFLWISSELSGNKLCIYEGYLFNSAKTNFAQILMPSAG